MDWKLGINRCRLLPMGWISNEILLCSTGNYVQSFMMEHDNMRKKNVYMYVQLGHHGVQQKKNNVLGNRQQQKNPQKTSLVKRKKKTLRFETKNTTNTPVKLATRILIG